MTDDNDNTPQQQRDAAHALYTKTFQDTTIDDLSGDFPQFALSELTIGKTLGEGGFGVVSEVLAFNIIEDSRRNGNAPDPTNGEKESNHDNIPNQQQPAQEGANDTTSDDLQWQGRHFIADHCLRNGTDARYAIKLLKPDITSSDNQPLLLKGLADLAIETHILSAITHPNIVKLRATSVQVRYHPHYFILMDRLYDTLEKRIEQWTSRNQALVPTFASPKKKKAPLFGCLASLLGKTGGDTNNKNTTETTATTIEQNKLLEERLVAVFDLAAALSYLHKRNIIYRDLKPENCAFDVRGDIKLFDFGTAKELPHQTMLRDQTFQLTGVTGSLPYMAPEVAATKPYNHKCDIFSFSMLLWQVMALEMPFAEYESDLQAFWEDVHLEGGPNKRPDIPRVAWPKPIELALKRGWAHTPAERMEMDQLEGILRKEIVRLRKGDAAGLTHDRRRSTFVFRR